MGSEARVIAVEKGKLFFGVRRAALFESLFFLSFMVAISYLFGDGHRFLGVTPHPFTIIILLVTVQYGTTEGLVCALLAIVFLYVGNIPPMKVEETIFEYQFRVGAMPLMWIVAALVLGELRMRIEHQKDKLAEDLAETQYELNVITEAYQQLKVIRENLEVNVVLQERTHTKIYRTLKALEVLNPAKILLNAHRVVSAAFDVKKFSLYATGEHGMEIVTSEGWDEGDEYLLRIGSNAKFTKEIVDEKRILCVINPDDEAAMEGQGVLAGPLIDPETNQVFGMLKIEDLGLMNLNISNLEVFQSLCELLGMTYVNARNFMKIKENGIYEYNPKLYSYAYYETLISVMNSIVAELKKPLTVMELTMESYFHVEAPSYALEPLLGELNRILPATSVVCYGNVKKAHLMVILPFIGEKQAEEIKDVLMKALEKNEVTRKEKVRIVTKF